VYEANQVRALTEEELQKLYDFQLPFEGGAVPWMYLDVKGYVTVSVGCLVDPLPPGLRFVKQGGELADDDEVRSEWSRVKSMQVYKLRGGGFFKDRTSLRMPAEDMIRLVYKRLRNNDAVLCSRFKGFAGLPQEAQTAVHSMAWAMGPWFRFPKFEAGLNARDYATCAAECRISEAGNPGVKPRNEANKALFLKLV
jgi:hypothetical protein